MSKRTMDQFVSIASKRGPGAQVDPVYAHAKSECDTLEDFQWASDTETIPDEEFFDDPILRSVNEYLPMFEINGVPFDERLAQDIRSSIVEDELLRMFHISVMEKLFGDKWGYAKEPIQRLFMKECTSEKLIIPVVSLNDHRDPLGFELSVGPKVEVLVKVDRLARAYERLWSMFNIKVSVSPPSSFIGKSGIVNPRLTRQLEYLVVSFDGHIDYQHGTRGITDIYKMASGYPHPRDSRVHGLRGLTAVRPRLFNTVDCGVSPRFSTKGFCAHLKEAIHTHDIADWDKDKDDLIAAEVDYRNYAERNGLPTKFEKLTPFSQMMVKFLFHRHYCGSPRLATELNVDDVHFVYAYVFDFNFACMAHYYIGSAYRSIPCQLRDPHLDLRCNTTISLFHPTIWPVYDLGGSTRYLARRSTGDLMTLLNVDMHSLPGADWVCVNWHHMFACRHSELIVPNGYWRHIRDLCILSGDVDGCNIEHIRSYGRDSTMSNDSHVRSRYPQHGLNNIYLGLLQKVVMFERLADNVILLHESPDWYKTRREREKAVSRFQQTIQIGSVVVNNVVYRLGREVNLREMYNAFQTEFDLYRPHLTHVKSWFLDDVE